MTAGVALVGSPFDRRRGRILRLSDDELQGDVAVDCFGGGHMPLYRVGAVRKVGSFEERLFFGYEELEYGLRLRSQGFHLYVNGALLLEQRSHWGRLGMGRAPSSAPLPPWREFYSRRNLLWILRRNGCRRAAARQTMVILGRMVVNVVSTRGNDRVRVRLLARALRDGWTGHLGRTVEPLAKY